MENYRKGKNVEEPLSREVIPIPNLPENFLWMKVNGGTQIYKVLKYALAEFPKHRAVVWTGSGPALKKTISCAEIMKHENDNALHQINKICYRTYEEYWEPLIEDLDQIVVKRRVPAIHILLSMDRLDDTQLGYQSPGTTIPFKKEIEAAEQNKKGNTPTKEFAAMGMGSSGNKKRPKNVAYQHKQDNKPK